MSASNFLVVIAGPTAVGKTALCVQLARYFNTDVVSTDSRQFFREMAIGTAKPTPEEQEGITHHFINSHTITEEYSAGMFEAEALALLDRLFQKHQVVIAAGGSGLYVRALTEGMDEIPDTDPAIREQLSKQLEEQGLELLLEKLKQLDPEYYEQVDKANPQRVVRALEVCMATGAPYSSFRKQEQRERPFSMIKIGLTRDREELYQRINLRVDQMLEAGLLEEVKQLYPYKNHNALQTVGYKEIFDYLDGAYDWEEAVRLLKRNTRRYAKRQLTWFNKDKAYKWFHPNQFKEIVQYIEEQINQVKD
ncbi:MAG: tRNA (adenosine(37)-N6)-dimethylallyltransferase MiaA [Hymenobacteraceae bacterium]|nr:tRNA (adenosine(37)-N6)-dimethylallyltransferase MiaA [Hymenobacteraceae bacterium]MDX5395267.1 tRNA (adenosine(37)-N6)-dimethylallyltransferase MiaA [Hymenobacteraceae bacterium]MDX5442837.1 tRNA (adenosine(37)-N6)-dimethylallyltransferase MiaA [Hymenobacteraceae bacterium]MDX5511305.1 tRNA (adenosine(37)-N6)-dimethylallyltransferase MiaA [Hymenobacteraceae bacterium]